MGVIGISILIGVYSFAPIFLFCEVGEQLRSRSDLVCDTICKLNWYSFPHKVQRMMPIIIVTAQNPQVLTADGDAVCSRDRFKKVCHFK